MSRGRVFGLALMIGAIILLIIGFTTAFDEQGSTEVGYPIIAVGVGFMLGGSYGMTFKPKKKINSSKKSQKNNRGRRRKG